MKRIVWLLLIAATRIRADGGAIVFHRVTGPFDVTVFAAPVPPRAGSLEDLSVYLQKDGDPILDATVALTLDRRSYPATRTGVNRLVYSASVSFNVPGPHRLTVAIHTSLADAEAQGDVNVLPPEPAFTRYWFWFALLPIGLALLILNRALKAKRPRRATGPPSARLPR